MDNKKIIIISIAGAVVLAVAIYFIYQAQVAKTNAALAATPGQTALDLAQAKAATDAANQQNAAAQAAQAAQAAATLAQAKVDAAAYLSTWNSAQKTIEQGGKLPTDQNWINAYHAQYQAAVAAGISVPPPQV
jgi:uncharacterized protein HemX